MSSGSVFRVDVRRKVRSFWSEERLSANWNPRNNSLSYGVPAVCIGKSVSHSPLPAGPARRDLQLPTDLQMLFCLARPEVRLCRVRQGVGFRLVPAHALGSVATTRMSDFGLRAGFYAGIALFADAPRSVCSLESGSDAGNTGHDRCCTTPGPAIRGQHHSPDHASDGVRFLRHHGSWPDGAD